VEGLGNPFVSFAVMREMKSNGIYALDRVVVGIIEN
jgi:hypothetical protein